MNRKWNSRFRKKNAKVKIINKKTFPVSDWFPIFRIFLRLFSSYCIIDNLIILFCLFSYCNRQFWCGGGVRSETTIFWFRAKKLDFWGHFSLFCWIFDFVVAVFLFCNILFHFCSNFGQNFLNFGQNFMNFGQNFMNFGQNFVGFLLEFWTKFCSILDTILLEFWTKFCSILDNILLDFLLHFWWILDKILLDFSCYRFIFPLVVGFFVGFW